MHNFSILHGKLDFNLNFNFITSTSASNLSFDDRGGQQLGGQWRRHGPNSTSTSTSSSISIPTSTSTSTWRSSRGAAAAVWRYLNFQTRQRDRPQIEHQVQSSLHLKFNVNDLKFNSFNSTLTSNEQAERGNPPPTAAQESQSVALFQREQPQT